VAALYEQRRIHHVGAFATLEDQMCAFAPDFDRNSAGFSPDRVDALVWAFAELLVEPMASEGYFMWAKEKAASLQPKPAPRPEPIYAIGSQEYAARQDLREVWYGCRESRAISLRNAAISSGTVSKGGSWPRSLNSAAASSNSRWSWRFRSRHHALKAAVQRCPRISTVRHSNRRPRTR
jgi:hypothetical protein